MVEQAVSQPVDSRCIRCSHKHRFAWWVERLWIGTEVVIKRIIFLKDDHQVLNSSRWLGRSACLAGCGCAGWSTRDRYYHHDAECQTGNQLAERLHGIFPPY